MDNNKLGLSYTKFIVRKKLQNHSCRSDRQHTLKMFEILMNERKFSQDRSSSSHQRNIRILNNIFFLFIFFYNIKNLERFIKMFRN